jgi:hypothetical protein
MIIKLDKYAVFVLLGCATVSPDDWCLAFQDSMMVSCSRWDFYVVHSVHNTWIYISNRSFTCNIYVILQHTWYNTVQVIGKEAI